MKSKASDEIKIPDYYRNSPRSEMVPFLPNEYMKVLEIGCGEGTFKQNLSDNTEYWGVEPDSVSIKIAEKRFADSRFIEGYFPEVEKSIPDSYFDVIVCNDIIEHVVDTEEFIYVLKKKLSLNGVLIASIPNVRFILNLKELLWDKDWEYKSSGILDRTHMRFFTEKSILRTLEKQGFNSIEIHGINSIMDGDLSFYRRIVKYIKFGVLLMIFGDDIQYLQFGVVAKNNDYE